MKPKLLAVSATDTVPAILCVAATGSDPAQGSDTSVAAAMLSSKLFFDGAGTHRPLPERKAGTSLCCPGAAAQTAQEWPGPWTIVTVKHGRSSASLAASPLSPDNGVREYSSASAEARRAAQCEGRQGSHGMPAPKRRGLLHPLSVQGVHAYGRPMAL